MNTSPQVGLWIAGAGALIAGFLLVMNDSTAGWFLIIMGMIDIGATTRPARAWPALDRGMTRWGLVAVTLLLGLLVLLAGAVLLLK